MTEQVLSEQLKARFGVKAADCKVATGETTLEIAAADVIEVMTALRDEVDFAFTQLTDLCGVDYSAYGLTEWETESCSGSGFSRGRELGLDPDVEKNERRFAVVYHLISISRNERLRVRVYLPDDAFPMIASVVEVWPVANWFEREAFDLYGILFENHPDLRRLLTDYGFVGHPFRKDFPISGHVEVKYDEEQGRCIYQPVSIEPRVLVPRVIRHDSRYNAGGGASDGFGQENGNA